MEKKNVNSKYSNSNRKTSLQQKTNGENGSSRKTSNFTDMDKLLNGTGISNNAPKIYLRDDVDVPKKINFMSDLFMPLKGTKWISEVEFHELWEENKYKQVQKINDTSYTEGKLLYFFF